MKGKTKKARKKKKQQNRFSMLFLSFLLHLSLFTFRPFSLITYK